MSSWVQSHLTASCLNPCCVFHFLSSSQEYPEDELLLVYDRSFAYGQCFYLVVTPEAKDRLLKVRSSHG